MAATLSLTTTMRSGLGDSGLNTALGTGCKLKIYDGTEPADASTALAGNTLLATLTLSNTPFGAGASGVFTAAAITSDSSADATGTATFGRVTKSDDTVMIQGNCAAASATFVLNTVSVVAGAVISCSSFTLTIPAGP